MANRYGVHALDYRTPGKVWDSTMELSKLVIPTVKFMDSPPKWDRLQTDPYQVCLGFIARWVTKNFGFYEHLGFSGF